MTLRHKRTDHYLSVFFVPLFAVKKGVPLYVCEACGEIYDESGRKWARPVSQAVGKCAFCGRDLSGEFSYCPYCGTPRRG
jgi:hypothetical protein